jgi:hypothetical protein
MKPSIQQTLIVALAVGTLWVAPEARAAKLDTVIDQISDRIDAYLKEKQANAISVGDFSGPPASSAGRKLKNLLEDELKSRNIEVAPFSNWEVRGEFQVDTEGDFATVQVITRLVNSQGVEVADFRQRVRDSVDNLADVVTIAQPAGVDLESPAAQVSNVQPADPPASATPPAGNNVAGQSPPAAGAQTPPAGNPPAGNPPAGTPPAGNNVAGQSPPAAGAQTPPAGNPPAGTPPAGNIVAGQSPPAAGAQTPPAGNPPAGTPPAGNIVAGQSPPSGAGATPPAAAGGVSGTQVSLITPSQEERDQRVVDAIANPSFHLINESTISASSSSPYHLEVKVLRTGQSGYAPIPVQRVGNGLAFIGLQEGDQYSIVITNTAEHDIGVELMIDGINSLHFSGFAGVGKYYVRGTLKNGGVPYSARIDGWYRDSQSVFAFLVSKEPDAVASQLGFPAKVGTITATIYPAWQEGEEPHPLQKQLGSARLGTAQGPEIGSQSTVVETHFGTVPLASMSVRYINPDPPVDLPIERPAN